MNSPTAYLSCLHAVFGVCAIGFVTFTSFRKQRCAAKLNQTICCTLIGTYYVRLLRMKKMKKKKKKKRQTERCRPWHAVIFHNRVYKKKINELNTEAHENRESFLFCFRCCFVGNRRKRDECRHTKNSNFDLHATRFSLFLFFCLNIDRKPVYAHRTHSNFLK